MLLAPRATRASRGPASPPQGSPPGLPLLAGAVVAWPPAKRGPDLGVPGEALRQKQLQPGRRLLVCFDDDPGWWHERLLIYPEWDSHWWVLSGDGDLYTEDMKDWVTVYDTTGSRDYPDGLQGGLVQFSHPVDDDELLNLIQLVRRRQPPTLTSPVVPARRRRRIAAG